MNIGTAQNTVHALKESLAKYGFDFSNAVAFVRHSEVMKGCRSGVQKLIHLA